MTVQYFLFRVATGTGTCTGTGASKYLPVGHAYRTTYLYKSVCDWL
jgi:hypothetical protein